ncbi:MAG: sigma 54-interacting transcriptional regulator, partial [Bacillota bacterium]
TLLRVLQEHEVTRIGGTKSKKVDVKVIAATNKDLKTAVENKSFRQDLYYRLNVFNINLPHLRERREDIPVLTEHILHRLRCQVDKQELTIDDQVKGILLDYDWPGNIRELENVLERAVFLCEGSVITAKELPVFDYKTERTGKGEDTLNLELVINTLSITNGNVKKAAEKLGVARSSIYRKLQKNDISYNNFR